MLALDQRELFFLANPRTVDMLKPQTENEHRSAWEDFRKDDRLRRLHGITGEEMEMLSRVALMGQISSTRDFNLYTQHGAPRARALSRTFRPGFELARRGGRVINREKL